MTQPRLTMRAGGSDVEPGPAEPKRDHPYTAEIEAERRGWYELAALVRSLTPEECLVPGYCVDPEWSWDAEAQRYVRPRPAPRA